MFQHLNVEHIFIIVMMKIWVNICETNTESHNMVVNMIVMETFRMKFYV